MWREIGESPIGYRAMPSKPSWSQIVTPSPSRREGPPRPLALNDGNRRRDGGAGLGRLRRLRTGAERICFQQLRFNRGAPSRRCRRKLRAQLVPLLEAVPTSMDFRGVQTSTHGDGPSRRSREPWPTASRRHESGSRLRKAAPRLYFIRQAIATIQCLTADRVTAAGCVTRRYRPQLLKVRVVTEGKKAYIG